LLGLLEMLRPYGGNEDVAWGLGWCGVGGVQGVVWGIGCWIVCS
jgi:hypothetical protein